MGNSAITAVLGGGGLTGIAWLTGVLAAWEGGRVFALDPHNYAVAANADRVIGTSAGSTVGSQVLSTSGGAEERYNIMTRRDLRNREAVPGAAPSLIAAKLAEVEKAGISRQEAAKKYIANTHELGKSDFDDRYAVIKARLPRHEWPDANLNITAIREDGEVVLFTKDSGVSLVDAVTASCAVPVGWPTITIDGHEYVDGGMFSSTNLEKAEGADKIVVLQPIDDPSESYQQLKDKALIFRPSKAATKHFGRDPLSPATQGYTAVAGYEDGLDYVAELKEYLDIL